MTIKSLAEFLNKSLSIERLFFEENVLVVHSVRF